MRLNWLGPLAGMLRPFSDVDEPLSDEEIRQFLLRSHLADFKQRLVKKHGGYSSNSATRRAARSFANDRCRKEKKRILKGKRNPLTKRELLARFRPSQILDGLDPGRRDRWTRLPFRRRLSSENAELALVNFNFLDDPIGTLAQIAELTRIECTELAASVHFEDPYCLDAGAYLVLAEFWPQMAPIFRGGRMKSPVQKVLSAIHLDGELGITLNHFSNYDDVWAFPIQRRRPKNTTRSATANIRPQEREVISDQFCDLVNEWLGVPLDPDNDNEPAWELSREGRAYLNNLIGELLCNAERHSQRNSNDGDWSTTAFMVRREKDDGSGWQLICYLAFLSVGLSMSETLESAAPAVRAYVQDYVRSHSGCGISDESLATVVALQDAVTCDPAATADQRGGTGLQDVLEFVTDLADIAVNPNAQAKLTIVSGKSCLKLVAPQLTGQRNQQGRRLQWCNKENDRANPPDARFVCDLPQHFAGTLVSVAFTLDPTYLDDSKAEDRNVGSN